MPKRWTAGYKLKILGQINRGELSIEDALKPPYEISTDELAEWQRNHATRGIDGLRTTKHPRIHGPYPHRHRRS